MFTKERCFCLEYRTWDQRKRSLFTVEGCSPKTNRAISSMVKYMGKMGPGKVFTIKRCSLIRGVHYERFHCSLKNIPFTVDSNYLHIYRSVVTYKIFGELHRRITSEAQKSLLLFVRVTHVKKYFCKP